MFEIIVARRIDDIPISGYKYLLDENGDIMKFKSKEHAIRYLREHGSDDEEIRDMLFIYTNESRECKCHICEKREDCYIQGKFQRLPRDTTNGLGLGLCPKLNKT